MTQQEFAALLADQIATVVGALVDAPASVSPAASDAPTTTPDAATAAAMPAAGDGATTTPGTATTPGATATPDGGPVTSAGARWVATLDGAAGAEGACTVAFDTDGARALTKVTTGVETAPPDTLVADTLREIVAQALGALSPHDEVQGAPSRVVTLALVPALDGASAAAPGAVPAAVPVAVPVADGTAFTLTSAAVPVALVITITGFVDLARMPSPPAEAGPRVAASPSADRIDVILDIELPLVVRFGRTDMPLRSLVRMGPGSLIDLGRSADDPVELLVSNRVVARGEVVVVGGNYGVRVLDVVSPRDRVRSMEV